MQEPYGIHWFRRDLRLHGNPALEWSRTEHRGRVLGVFCFDRKFLGRPDFSSNRFQFFLETLRELRLEMNERGGDLIILDQGPLEAFGELFSLLKRKGQRLPSTVSFNRDYEPFAIRRDSLMTDQFVNEFGLKVHSERDHLLIEPHEILKEDKEAPVYQVFSPYARRWLEKFKTSEVEDRIKDQNTLAKRLKFTLRWNQLSSTENPSQNHLEDWLDKNAKSVTVKIPKAGPAAAMAALERFRAKVSDYGLARDFPAINGTSHLSIYLKNGSITTAQIVSMLGLKAYPKKTETGAEKYLSELIWREFYYYILAHHPRVEKGAFLEKYNDLEWENCKDFFEAWKNGTTGFPIVDAAMRQLKQTGWMHNRLRMIVASFLCKDLLIDWRWGERYFMETLLDGDLAPNNGGWQWAASTGCDPQPYFRIFNPELQGKKFDPSGEFVRSYLPELRAVPDKKVHEVRNGIVDHATQRTRALALYKRVRQS